MYELTLFILYSFPFYDPSQRILLLFVTRPSLLANSSHSFFSFFFFPFCWSSCSICLVTRDGHCSKSRGDLPLFPALSFMMFTILCFFMTNHNLTRLLTCSLQISQAYFKEDQENMQFQMGSTIAHAQAIVR